MMELEPLEEKSNKGIDPQCEALLYDYFSLYEMAEALGLDSYKRSKNEVKIPLKY